MHTAKTRCFSFAIYILETVLSECCFPYNSLPDEARNPRSLYFFFSTIYYSFFGINIPMPSNMTPNFLTLFVEDRYVFLIKQIFAGDVLSSVFNAIKTLEQVCARQRDAVSQSNLMKF